MSLCQRCKKSDGFPIGSSYNQDYKGSAFEQDMRNILTHLKTMEQLLTKFTSIFSECSIIGVTEPMTKHQNALTVHSNNEPAITNDLIDNDTAPIIASDQNFQVTQINHEEDVILAEAYVAEKLAESELDDSRDMNFVTDDMLSDPSMTDDSLTIEMCKKNVKEIIYTDDIKRKKTCKKYVYFPIKTQDDMIFYENRLRLDNGFKAIILSDLKELKKSYGRNYEFTDIVERVIHRDLLHNYNWTGNKGKEPLKCFRLFSELMKQIISSDQGPFEEVMTRAIALSHRRKNNQVYRQRLKESSHHKTPQDRTVEALEEAYELI